MRMPRVEVWAAAGSPEEGVGFITHSRVPFHWWIIQRWLEYGHPHWGWWNRLWSRALPDWGDPFCAAYTVVWARFYYSREERRHTFRVGWDALPDAIKADILARGEEG